MRAWTLSLDADYRRTHEAALDVPAGATMASRHARSSALSAEWSGNEATWQAMEYGSLVTEPQGRITRRQRIHRTCSRFENRLIQAYDDHSQQPHVTSARSSARGLAPFRSPRFLPEATSR
jgi:hypothetical protein